VLAETYVWLYVGDFQCFRGNYGIWLEQLVWGHWEIGLHVGVYGREGEFSICTGLTGMNGKNRVVVVKGIMGTK
jgi:hypothetical protein